MKKLILIVCALLLAGGVIFSQEEGSMIFRGAAGIMYIHSLYGYNDFSLSSFRGGFHGDLLYNMGRMEIGAELGVYMMEIEDWYGDYLYDYYYAIDIPVNALVRYNFDRDKLVAAEVRAGLWLSLAVSSYDSIDDIDVNVGGRLVFGFFYIGADYILGLNLHYPAVTVEAGVKVNFE